MNKIDQYFMDKGKFTEEEFQEHGDKIRNTFIYRKIELEFALRDVTKEMLNVFKKK